MGAALGDAAWMTGLERNSDLIVMSAYAPLLVNVDPGGMQWETDLIGYNAIKSYGSPAYYAQVMFASYLGDHTVASKLENAGPKLFYSSTINTAKKQLYLKLVNASSDPQPVQLALPGAQPKVLSKTDSPQRARHPNHQQHRRSQSARAGGVIRTRCGRQLPAHATGVFNPGVANRSALKINCVTQDPKVPGGNSRKIAQGGAQRNPGIANKMNLSPGGTPEPSRIFFGWRNSPRMTAVKVSEKDEGAPS